MLGNIARNLRLLGFNCKYFATIKDTQILTIAKNENRTLITKNHEIINTCKKFFSIIDVLDVDETSQIIEICKKINFKKCRIDTNYIRCTYAIISFDQ